MNFNAHSNLKDKHAFLSASKYHWLNYDKEKLIESYENQLATVRGTILHAFAATAIKLNQKLPKSQRTLNLYVNDAIGYRMIPEQVVYYSENCFGTVDAISFRQNKLRIHDLKTGVVPAHMEQLEIYAALFCLEYDKDPNKIDIELRIYQNDQIIQYIPSGDEIMGVMNKIVDFDEIIEEVKTRNGVDDNE